VLFAAPIRGDLALVPDQLGDDALDIFARTITMNMKFPVAVALLLLVAAAPLLGACQTTAGAGEDISAGGHALTNSAEKHAP
jgi:entericidin B